MLAYRIGHSPYIRIVSQTPPTMDVVILACCDDTRLCCILQKRKHRHVEFTEVSRLCCPVVFLEVDVRSVVAAPGRQQLLVPQSLQVGRDTHRT